MVGRTIVVYQYSRIKLSIWYVFLKNMLIGSFLPTTFRESGREGRVCAFGELNLGMSRPRGFDIKGLSPSRNIGVNAMFKVE